MVTGNKELKIRKDQKSGDVVRGDVCVLGQLWPLLVVGDMEINNIFWKKIQNEKSRNSKEYSH